MLCYTESVKIVKKGFLAYPILILFVCHLQSGQDELFCVRQNTHRPVHLLSSQSTGLPVPFLFYFTPGSPAYMKGKIFMNNTYSITIAGLSRELPLCRVTDELYIGAFVMFGDVEITMKTAEQLLQRAPEFDVIVTAEAKGIPLAYEMARQSGKYNYVVARKYPKLYMKNVVATKVRSITTDHEQTLYLAQDESEYLKGKRVLIVDDVISTGESVYAVEKLVEQAEAIVAGRMAVLAEGDAANRNDIIYLEKLPLFNPDGTVK